ncbi:hypothetical protein RCO48_10980 [Peribacillus frigoritolerans]|nr:hypothetical protein [Peribacillus frigoritolerans]
MIFKEAISVGVGVVHSEVIDEINIYQATKKGNGGRSERSVRISGAFVDRCDGTGCADSQLSLIKGDARSISISAASIIAKVTRDRMMKEYGEKYPEYGFEKHMGYGTSQHLEALDTHGLTPWHRRSFAPVKEIAARTKE